MVFSFHTHSCRPDHPLLIYYRCQNVTPHSETLDWCTTRPWFMINIVWGKLSGFIQCSYMIFHVVYDTCGWDNLVCGFMIHSYVRIQWCLLLRMFIWWWVNCFRCKFNSPCSKYETFSNILQSFWNPYISDRKLMAMCGMPPHLPSSSYRHRGQYIARLQVTIVHLL